MSKRVNQAEMTPSEHQIQAAFFEWWALSQPAEYQPMAFAIPNGGYRTPRTGATLRREGVRAGVPDVMIAIPRPPYAGLWLEFKTPAGKASPAQRQYLHALKAVGYQTAIVRSVEEAIDQVQVYLKGG